MINYAYLKLSHILNSIETHFKSNLFMFLQTNSVTNEVLFQVGCSLRSQLPV